MRKITNLLTLLVMAVVCCAAPSRAMAQTVTVDVTMANDADLATHGTGDAAKYFNVWTSSDETAAPGLILTSGSNNNMDYKTGALRICFGGVGGAYTYTLTAPSGYKIDGYTMTGTTDADNTIKPAKGGDAVAFTAGTEGTVTTTGVNAVSTTFTVETQSTTDFTLTAFTVMLNKIANWNMPTVSTAAAPALYTIRSARKPNHYVAWTLDYRSMSMTDMTGSDNGSCKWNGGSLFYFLEAGETTNGVMPVKVANLMAGGLCSAPGSFGDGITWYLKAYAVGDYDGLAISKNQDHSGNNSWNDFQGSGSSVDLWSSADAGSLWVIEPVSNEDVVANGATILTETKRVFNKMAKHFAFNASAYATYQATLEALQSGTTYDEVIASALAVKKAYEALIKSCDGSYFKFLNAKHNQYMTFNESNGTTTAESGSKAIWKLELEETNGCFRLYNEYAKKYLNAFPGLFTAFRTVPVYAAGEYDIKQLDNGNYTVQEMINKTNNSYLHNQYSSGVHSIVGWSYTASTTDDASQWQIVSATEDEVTQLATDVATADAVTYQKAVIKNTLDWWKSNILSDVLRAEGEIGYQLTPDCENAWTLAESEVSTIDECESALNTIWTTNVEDLILANDVSTKYYQISVQRTNNPLAVIYANPFIASDVYDARLLYFGSDVTNVVTTLFQLEAEDSRYVLRHVNSDVKAVDAATTTLYMGQVQGWSSQVEMPSDRQYAGKFLFKRHNNGGEKWALLEASQNNYLSTENAALGEVVSWGSQDEGNAWTFTEVTTIPVTISDAKYATLHLPVAVQLPAELKAYTATIDASNATRLVLNEISSGVIPANTPVILNGEATSYDLTIVADVDAIEGNALEGTNLAKHDMVAEQYYGLANKTAGVGMYLSTVTTLPANKAYLPKPAGAATSAYYFDFTTTGVNGVATNGDKNETYFDLNGRRVLYPTTGVYVTSTGKKVYLK